MTPAAGAPASTGGGEMHAHDHHHDHDHAHDHGHPHTHDHTARRTARTRRPSCSRSASELGALDRLHRPRAAAPGDRDQPGGRRRRAQPQGRARARRGGRSLYAAVFDNGAERDVHALARGRRADARRRRSSAGRSPSSTGRRRRQPRSPNPRRRSAQRRPLRDEVLVADRRVVRVGDGAEVDGAVADGARDEDDAVARADERARTRRRSGARGSAVSWSSSR